MGDFRVPRHEPEVVAARAGRDHRGDEEKVPTTAIKSLIIHGVTISSRYGKADELEVMAAMVAGVVPPLRSAIRSIWCDSSANVYAIMLDNCSNRTGEQIADQIEATIKIRGRRDRFYIDGVAGGQITRDPN
jgi:hypothetical protein